MSETEIRLSAILKPKAVVLDLPTGKDDAIRALIAAAIGAYKKLPSEEEIFESVMEREKVMSTGMGHGVALPHAKLEGIEDFTFALGRASSGISYDSLDGSPVRILVLMLSPAGMAREHVKWIAEISKRFKFAHLRTAITEAGSAREIISAIRRSEATR